MEYDDIINMSHHVSEKRPKMSVNDRAAQFAPFSALCGYNEAVWEKARHTDERYELSCDEKEELNLKLDMIKMLIEEQPEISVLCFKNDEFKSGGTYVSQKSYAVRVDEEKRILYLRNGSEISFDDIYEISGKIFND